jgi:hypothetical protein
MDCFADIFAGLAKGGASGVTVFLGKKPYDEAKTEERCFDRRHGDPCGKGSKEM